MGTDQSTFDSIQSCYQQQAEQHASPSVKTMLVGNKCDLDSQRIVESSSAKEYAETMKIPFLETSVKDNINVEQIFVTIASLIMNYHKSPSEPGMGSSRGTISTCSSRSSSSSRSTASTCTCTCL